MTGNALRFNTGKPQISKLFEFGSALDKLVRVMSQGAIKYDDGNWLLGGQDAAQFLDSGMRHMRAYKNGESYDPDTGCHHLAHAAWNSLAALRILHDEDPDLTPEFDQDAFVSQYSDRLTVTETAEDAVVDAMVAAEAPHMIEDSDGDIWYRDDNGLYSMERPGSTGYASVDYIRDQYGLAE